MNDIAVGSIVIGQTKSGDQLSFRFETDKALWQGYNDETGAVVPDWTITDNQPTIRPKCFSARLGKDVNKSGSGTWTYNGTVISFEALTGISTNFDGAFKIDSETDALTIVKNLASSSNQNNDILTYNANWDNGYAESVGGQIEVTIDKVGSTPYNGIVNLSTNVLNETGGVTSLTATAVLMRGSTTLTSGFTTKWYKQGSTTVLGTGTNLTIDRSMVSGKETFYCEFYVGGVLQSVYYFSVYDMSDPAQVRFELNSTNDTTDEGKPVEYLVKLIRTAAGTQIAPVTFSVKFYNSREKEITSSTSTLTQNSGTGTLTVTYEDGEKISSDGLKNGAIRAQVTAEY
ncbi:MAG TPA: hypothetical protein DDW85_03350 [Porphyromonadaceae bacterium]|nr:hypothetical protein [Porphyromonadaceae bacterium]